MSTRAITSTSHLQERAGQAGIAQYTLWQILGIWALVALPMALLAWVVAPAVIPRSPLSPEPRRMCSRSLATTSR